MKKGIREALLGLAAIAAAYSGLNLIAIREADACSAAYWKSVALKRETQSQKGWESMLPEYRPLYEANEDIVGWISIEGAHIDYPVMQTKDEPEFYLRRNYDKEDDRRGTPFADYRCDLFPDQSFNTIIYGHNSAFRWLFEYAYRNRYQLLGERVRFDTLYERGEYEFVASYYFDGTDAELLSPWDPGHAQAYECYNFIDGGSKKEVRKFAENIERNRLFDTGKSISERDHILTLICCATKPFSGIEENGRLAVIAKKVE